ncbi:MAG: fimbrillin family protein [Bacteroidaceae bacterium]|nr:fimbrillin family protein [Bacteroidaceae bacterium]
MKKHWTTYLLGICALLIGSCTEHEVLIDPPTIAANREVPISFSNSHVDYAATRHDHKLCTHLTTMGVWGWRNGMWDDNALAFDNQAVCYNSDSARWEYNPLQYWHKDCQYTFCAYAPHQRQTDAIVSVDSATHMIHIHHVTLYGHNLQDTPTDTVKELFRDTPDTDWMVARAGQTAVGKAGMDVEFMMQHILAKLNIRIKADSALLRKRFITQLTANSIVVGALAAEGDFHQQLTHTPILTNPEEASLEEWSVGTPTLYIKGTHACPIAASPTYLVESLVLPQHITAEATVTLYYTYHFANGHTEQCRHRIALTDAFSRFASGHNYTLTFTLRPCRITFEAGATGWENGASV